MSPAFCTVAGRRHLVDSRHGRDLADRVAAGQAEQRHTDEGTPSGLRKTDSNGGQVISSHPYWLIAANKAAGAAPPPPPPPLPPLSGGIATPIELSGKVTSGIGSGRSCTSAIPIQRALHMRAIRDNAAIADAARPWRRNMRHGVHFLGVARAHRHPVVALHIALEFVVAPQAAAFPLEQPSLSGPGRMLVESWW